MLMTLWQTQSGLAELAFLLCLYISTFFGLEYFFNLVCFDLFWFKVLEHHHSVTCEYFYKVDFKPSRSWMYLIRLLKQFKVSLCRKIKSNRSWCRSFISCITNLWSRILGWRGLFTPESCKSHPWERMQSGCSGDFYHGGTSINAAWKSITLSEPGCSGIVLFREVPVGWELKYREVHSYIETFVRVL